MNWEELIKKHDIRNPNNGEPLTEEQLERFANLHGEKKRVTLVSLALMCELNDYVPNGTTERLKNEIKSNK